MSNVNYPIKLLLLDIDGTLVPSKFLEPDPRIVELVRRVSKKITVCFCTGRSLNDVIKEIQRYGLENSYHIIENGTKVIGPKIIEEYSKNILKYEAEMIVNTGKSKALDYGICENGTWRDSVEEITGEGVTMVALNSSSKAMTEQIIKSISHLKNDYSIVVSGHSSFPDGAHVHVTHKEGHKGFGVRYLQTKLGIRKQETAGAGDMPNDLPMLMECGIKIAMGNAHPDLLKIADKIVGKVNERGLLDFLEDISI